MGVNDGDPPTVEHLRSIGKSWEEIAESAAGVRAHMGSGTRSKLPVHRRSLTKPIPMIETLLGKYRPGVNLGSEHDLKLAEEIDETLLALGATFVCEDWSLNWTTHL